MMLRKTNFEDVGVDYYDKINHKKALKFLKKRAASLGYTLEKQGAQAIGGQ